MDDLISRQALSKAMYQAAMVEDSDEQRWDSGCWIRYKMFERVLESMPSAQPEIVRCKDCKWYELPSHKITENCVRWMKSNCILLPIKPNDYCSYAERKTDEQT